MRKRKFISDPNILLELGRDIVKQPDEPDFLHKVAMVNLVLEGKSALELSQSTGESARTIARWVQTADEYGFEALRRVKQPGRTPRLSAVHLDHISRVIEDDPRSHGLRVWDGPSLSSYIERIYGIKLGVRQCQRILRELNFSLLRAQPYPNAGECNEEEREAFKKEIAEINNDPHTIVVYQDEAHFKQTTSITRMWARKGSRPRIKSPPGNKSVAYSGIVNPGTGVLHMTKMRWFTYETVIESFRDFIRNHPPPKGCKYCLVMDNAPWHKKAYRLIVTEEREEYKDIRQAMCFKKLPAYSPDLNPQEQCWRMARHEVTHNRYFPTIETLEFELDTYFEEYSTPNDKFKSLCSFKF